MEVWARTEVGLVRQLNEDSFLVKPERGFLAVADGMGGHQAGEVASQLAVATLDRVVQGVEDDPQPGLTLERAFLEANTEVWRQGQSNPDFYGMGTTLTAVLVGDKSLSAAHVGDSRLYLCREGKLRQLTSDHSVVEELLRSGVISPQAAVNHPFRHILTRALGTEKSVNVDLIEETTMPGDRLMLCSDGLTNLVSDQELEKILGDPDHTPESSVDELTELALKRGGHDNITVVIAHLDL
ncbi:MAG: Stp1/IreP family PP2C-type Ser/Thr phosphatase [Firmicutes bacterium]|nr:Stp1/IreP family PP2C-type Ser/Thr phosphatase [Bacillota bacterium]